MDSDKKLTPEQRQKAWEQFNWILKCQENDRKYEELFNNDGGLQLEEIRFWEEEPEEEWIESGRESPNKWRLK